MVVGGTQNPSLDAYGLGKFSIQEKTVPAWKVNQTADGLPMEKQQLAIDRVVEAFAKYSETDYFVSL